MKVKTELFFAPFYSNIESALLADSILFSGEENFVKTSTKVTIPNKFQYNCPFFLAAVFYIAVAAIGSMHSSGSAVHVY